MPSHRHRRFLLSCTLCAAAPGCMVEPTGPRALYAAIDHALDHHRDELLFDHRAVLDELRVVWPYCEPVADPGELPAFVAPDGAALAPEESP